MSRPVYALIHEEAGDYGISFPDFPGCVSGGSSHEEALARGMATLEFHILGMIADGDPIPRARSLDELAGDPTFAGDAASATIIQVQLKGAV